MTDEKRQEGEDVENTPPALHKSAGRISVSQWIAGAVLLVFVLLFSGVLWLWLYAIHPVHPSDSSSIIVEIQPGTGFAGIRQNLEKAGVLKPDVRFSLLAHFLAVSRNIKAGEYEFAAGRTPVEILRLLESGKVVQWPVTVPEGTNIYQLAAILNASLSIQQDQFLAKVQDEKTISSLGLPGFSLEGYLFPDTYKLTRNQSVESILAMMTGRFFTVYKEIAVKNEGAAAGAEPLSRHEIVTLASIVEKEAAIAEERPLVAAVFLNRLKKKMRLQADPTVIYGLKKFDMALTKKDLKTPTAYNTYVNKGLPEGPICNPGKDSLLAVLNPAQSPYLYFVSKNDGTHQFSRTLKEHNRAVYQFQR